MTSVGWPVLTGRRRRHRPVIRTVRLPPLSADHSTDSIDTADVPGNSLIVRDGTSPGGRTSRPKLPIAAQCELCRFGASGGGRGSPARGVEHRDGVVLVDRDAVPEGGQAIHGPCMDGGTEMPMLEA